jgi:hypothetical protein
VLLSVLVEETGDTKELEETGIVSRRLVSVGRKHIPELELERLELLATLLVDDGAEPDRLELLDKTLLAGEVELKRLELLDTTLLDDESVEETEMETLDEEETVLLITDDEELVKLSF